MPRILRMPEVLANATEAVIASWSIEEGAVFAAGDVLAEVETEKALVDLPAEEAGILGRRLVRSGDATAVGDPIAVLLAEGETQADIDGMLDGGSDAGAEPETAGPEAEPFTEATDEEAVEATPAAPVVPAAPAASAVPAPAPASAPASTATNGRVFSSPLARKLAREAGLDLHKLTGTGPDGRIVRADVLTAISESSRTTPNAPARSAAVAPVAVAPAAAAPSAPATASASDAFVELPHSGMRRAIARRLTESKSTVPHFYLSADCRVDALLDLRKQINASGRVKISVNDFVVKAAAAAFVEVPEANVTWTDTAIRQWNSVDISVAVATDGGLVTPVVRNVESLSLSALSRRIGDLVETARTGRLKQGDLEGGSFSVTNLGMYGTREFTAIINPPQSGILAVGAATQQVVAVDGQPTVATVMRVTLSADHRAVDGALGARWLAAFQAAIEDPLAALV